MNALLEQLEKLDWDLRIKCEQYVAVPFLNVMAVLRQSVPTLSSAGCAH